MSASRKVNSVFAAVKNAKGGPIEEGDVGAGTGRCSSAGKAALEPRHAACPTVKADTPRSMFLCKRISAASSRCGAAPLGQYYLHKELSRPAAAKTRQTDDSLSSPPPTRHWIRVT